MPRVDVCKVFVVHNKMTGSKPVKRVYSFIPQFLDVVTRLNELFTFCFFWNVFIYTQPSISNLQKSFAHQRS